MPVKGLRDWLKAVEKMGELKKIDGAHWDLELGAITDLYQQKPGSPALLFDNIADYPEGFRVLSNSCMSLSRTAFTLDLPTDIPPLEFVKLWREKTKKLENIAPRVVSDGPVLENVITDPDEIDVLKFPVPKWHEKDGGRFIGTGCLVVNEDPETGWVNCGTYRVQSDASDHVIVRMSPGRHGITIRDKYWDKGEPCPIAIVVGQDPLLYLVSGIEVPFGVSEYDYAGGIRNEAVDVIKAPKTGLPVPATAEIVIEGEMHKGDMLDEGPFGEWTGYYGGGVRPEPVVRVTSILHRNNPINLGTSPAVPPSDTTYYRSPLRSAMIWDQLEGACVPEVKGVWAHELGGGRMLVVVSINQVNPGQSRQAAYVAANCFANAYSGRLTIVVDDDIDVSDLDQVMWAVVTRCDPVEDLEILKKTWSTRLDPLGYPSDDKIFNNRMIIDACRSFERLETFPDVATTSPELKKKIQEKWKDLFPVPKVNPHG